MSELYSIWKRLSHVRLDGINYDIGVKQRDDGRFTVSWICLNCFEQGPPSPAAETLEMAVAFAHFGLRAHHALLHTDARRNGAAAESTSPTFADDGQEQCADERYRAAFERARTTFERLCAVHAQMSASNGHHANSQNVPKEFIVTCHDWIATSHEFDAALEAFSVELQERSKTLEAKLAGSTAS